MRGLRKLLKHRMPPGLVRECGIDQDRRVGRQQIDRGYLPDAYLPIILQVVATSPKHPSGKRDYLRCIM